MNRAKIKKYDAIAFIRRIKRKAIEHIDNKHKPEIEKVKIELMKEHGYYEQYVGIQEKIDQLYNEAVSLEDKLEKDFGLSYRYRNLRQVLHECTTRKDGRKQYIEGTISRLGTKDAKSRKLMKAYNDERLEVEAEYDKIIRRACNLKRGSQIETMLKNLGFDTTKLLEMAAEDETQLDVNKDKLFVCGEKS